MADARRTVSYETLWHVLPHCRHGYLICCKLHAFLSSLKKHLCFKKENIKNKWWWKCTRIIQYWKRSSNMTILNSYGLIQDGHLLNIGQLADMVIYLGVRSSCVHIGLGWCWWEPESEHTCGDISLALHLSVTSANLRQAWHQQKPLTLSFFSFFLSTVCLSVRGTSCWPSPHSAGGRRDCLRHCTSHHFYRG